MFKLLFTSRPESHALLVALLTAVLKPAKPFSRVIVRNPELVREAPDDRGAVLDIFAELSDGTRLDIEMQSDRRESFRQRALFYWARMFGAELDRGDGYGDLHPAISVLFLGYRELQGTRVHSTFHLLEVHDHERFSNAIELHIIELPKLARVSDQEQREDTRLLTWARFLAARSDEELQEVAMADPAVEKAHKLLQQMSQDPETRRIAERRAMELSAWKYDLEASRREGRAEGRAEGRVEGRVEGRAEAVRWITDLCELLQIDVDDARRARLEAMSGEELEELRLALKRARKWPE